MSAASSSVGSSTGTGCEHEVAPGGCGVHSRGPGVSPLVRRGVPVERQHQAHIDPGPVVEGQLAVGEDPLGGALASARAPGADAAARKALVDRLATLDLGSARVTADRLQQLLSSGTLATLQGSTGD